MLHIARKPCRVMQTLILTVYMCVCSLFTSSCSDASLFAAGSPLFMRAEGQQPHRVFTMNMRLLR
jgi:hypothetical protein